MMIHWHLAAIHRLEPGRETLQSLPQDVGRTFERDREEPITFDERLVKCLVQLYC